MHGMPPSHHIELSEDAALVAALAGTAMSFSHSAEDQAERWLRALRLHGQVGTAMQALGVGEAPLMTRSDPVPDVGGVTPPLGDDAVDRVVKLACEHATVRGAGAVCTTDLLHALFEVYDGLIGRALYLRGASKEELLQQLEAVSSAVEPA